MVSDILSGRPERMSAKKGSAAARLQPKIFCFRLSPRNSLALLAQTRRGLFTAGTKNFPPRVGFRRNGRGAGPVLNLHRAWGAGVMFGVCGSHTPGRAHIGMTAFFFMAVEVLRRVQARSLVLARGFMREV